MADLIWSCPQCSSDLEDLWCPVCEQLWSPQVIAAWDDWDDPYERARMLGLLEAPDGI